MKIIKIDWNKKSIGHIAKHQVIPEEVEAVCFSNPWIIKRTKGKSKYRYAALGQTYEGRYLAIFFVYIGKGKIRIITARDMDSRERSVYKKR